MKKLNIGAGRVPLPGYVNLDIQKLPGIDVIHDLTVFPYPFKDGTFDVIEAHQVLEHFVDTQRIMEELHRILKKNGILKIDVPYFVGVNSWGNPDHKHAFTYDSFFFFSNSHRKRNPSKYGHLHTGAGFESVRVRLWFPKGFHILGWLWDIVFNLMPNVYENTILRYLIPAEGLFVEMKK